MAKTFRYHERFYKVKPREDARGWLKGELARFHEEDRSLSELIDAASMAAWVADHRNVEHR